MSDGDQRRDGRPEERAARAGEPPPALPDDLAPAASAALPGEHRGGFQREFTEPVPITESVHTDAAHTGPDVRWAPVPPSMPRSAAWALAFSVAAVLVSLLVGWGFLIGVLGGGLAIAALRRPWESRPVAVWALCLSLLSLLYSAGWLWWASTQGPLFG
ncbi:hypothetical protein [Microbacterium flavum]|uniref:hypothetical protein n=1 Tax=Microbacterium flavum TaxID=415216 RepID=UPI001FEBC30E|nr:hypothetical protein [Microbacterium flavum]